MDREEYMEYALALASRAAEEGEIPVGCVIADADGNIIGRGRNKREESTTQRIMPRSRPYAKRAAQSAIGGWAAARYMSRLSLARCAPGR